MKYKNYKSAIHNFAHSFMSIDYLKSGRLAVNVLIDLYNIKIVPKATFDFINKTIKPNEAKTQRGLELLNDYLNWLPKHFENHNCDLTKLEKFEITIWIDFEKIKIPYRMKNAKEFIVLISTTWKAEERNEQTIEISQTEMVKDTFLKTGIPEFYK